MSQELQPASKKKHLDPAGYLSDKTIAALCSPTGGAICILRLSGESAFKITEKITGIVLIKDLDRRATRVWIHDDQGKRIDDAILIPFFNPRSFTGEDVVEFFLHGSSIIAQKVLDLMFSNEARLALPGEFSFRAVKNGKMMLSQAEAVKELIAAENDFALDLAIEKLSGSQHVLIDQIRTDLMQLVTLSEVGIDFSDQDIDEVSLPRLKMRLIEIIKLLNHLMGSFDRGKRFLDGIPVSIFGLPNAGKSSFFNSLLGEDRSIVSNIAGTTRDVVREKLNLRGEHGYVSFKLSDTAGLRKSGDEIEEIGIERSLKAAKDADLILVIIDGVDPNVAEATRFLEKLATETELGRKRFIGVTTKKDLLFETETEELNNAISSLNTVLKIDQWYSVSSVNLEGITEVAQRMTALAEGFLERSPGEVLLTQFEHVQAVKKSLECLKRAMNEASDLVLFATDVRHGMNELGPLIGETLPDDVLGKIFSDFCIGK